MKNETEKEIRYIDLFAGVGGFRLGVERAFDSRIQQSKQEEQGRQDRNNISSEEGSGFSTPTIRKSERICGAECVFTNEWDKYCCQVYSKNFGTKISPIDIRTVDANSIPDFDLLCAGFPCQAFSIAGKRRGFEDTKGTLFFEIARIAEAKRPSHLLLENVKGLLNHEKGKTFRVILQTLSELGYDIQWMVFNSKFFGVPQNRERVFIVGNIREKPRPKILPFRKNVELPEEAYPRLLPCLTATDYKGPSRQRPTMIINGIRRLTPIECERLQGFPDNWTAEGTNEKGEIVKISDTQRYRMMGNAVTVNVIEAIVSRMFKLTIY